MIVEKQINESTSHVSKQIGDFNEKIVDLIAEENQKEMKLRMN